jgi:kynureninase
VIRQVEQETGQAMEIISPLDHASRGCQVSVRVKGKNKQLVRDLAAHGVIVDWREPDTIRLAPVPMYNSFEDVYRFGAVMNNILSK